MADLNVPKKEDIVPSEPGKKTKHTERKPISKPQEVQKQVQVHRGNVDLLGLKFLEQISLNIKDIAKAARIFMERKNG